MTPALSVYLDALRFTAAMVVFLAHASYARLTGGVLPGFGLLADDAVMAFFVLSGFVIAWTAEKKKHAGLGEYASARLARLYSVAIPALLLTVVVDPIGLRFAPEIYPPNVYEGDVPLLRLGAALIFCNELWFATIRPFSNGPFWSLGYEV